jgi:hypothetical protein
MPIDRDKLRELTERIQVGDTDEGADALGEIVDMVRTDERANAADTRHAVRQELADLQLKSENDAALGKFARRYPALTKDPVLVEAAAHVLRDELARDLKHAGVTDDELSSIRDDVGRLAGLHGKARIMGHEGVRSADKLLDDVGGVLAEKFHIKPAGTGRTPEQYVRDMKRERGFKVSDEDPVGRRDGSRAPNAGRLTQDQQERTRRVVREMRQARGFASHE